MAFVKREFDVEKDFPEYRKLLGVSEKIPLVTPQGWIIDEEGGINFFELGGRGEMPASTGAPPYSYFLIVGSLVYKINLRSGRSQGEKGGLVYHYSVESIEYPVGNLLAQEEVISLLRDLLFVCANARLSASRSKSTVENVLVS